MEDRDGHEHAHEHDRARAEGAESERRRVALILARLSREKVSVTLVEETSPPRRPVAV